MKDPSVGEFCLAAEQFCEIAACEAPVTIEDLWSIRELLLRLIFHIPAVEAHQHSAEFDGHRMNAERYDKAMRRFSELPFNLYQIAFDPHDFSADDQLVMGMLADDLADIYRDLAEGLDNFRQGHPDDACFDWSQSYSFHWARHAVHALTAIELYRTDHQARVGRAKALDT